MDPILAVATLLGGGAAVWFFWDKVAPFLRRALTRTTAEATQTPFKFLTDHPNCYERFVVRRGPHLPTQDVNRVVVMNTSSQIVEDVRVLITGVEPLLEPHGWTGRLPMPIAPQLASDPGPDDTVRLFPGEPRAFNLIGMACSWRRPAYIRVFHVAHSMGAETALNFGNYVFTIKVTGRAVPSLESQFDVGLDADSSYLREIRQTSSP